MFRFKTESSLQQITKVFSFVALWSITLTSNSGFAQSAGAQTYLPPSPYLQASDSPFRSSNFSYFFLENFEDGLLNTPGVTSPSGRVIGPGPFTDSVDSDDGVIDGSGNGGHSYYSDNQISISFRFNSAILGSLPTHVGLVWTDVAFSTPQYGRGNVFFEAFDANQVSLGVLGPYLLGDGSATGGTAEDRFFGAVNLGGISKIIMTMPGSTDWEVDHLQYGSVLPSSSVPEPGSIALLAGLWVSGSMFALRQIRRRRE